MIHEVCEIYELILRSTGLSPTEKKNNYDNYAEFLVRWGLYEAAIGLLYKKIALTDMDMTEEQLTMAKVG